MNALVPMPPPKEITDVVVCSSSNKGMQVKVKSKEITVGGKKFTVDPYQMMRMIKHITQTIGEYKKSDNPYSSYVISALRKARGDMVADLEHNFRINWEVDDEGRSNFYI